MRRDIRLQRLALEHHHALVVSRRVSDGSRDGPVDPALVADLRRIFLHELSPHFVREEFVLLPALEAAGEGRLVERVRREHREIRRLAERLHELESLRAFAELLRVHVRFEERELFPCCERRLDDEVLDRLGEG